MFRPILMLTCGAIMLLTAGEATPQAARRVPPAAEAGLPRPEPVAETRLLMEGLNAANFQGLSRLLRDKPAGVEPWTFARGQALLIAETGNLLMLRPPRNAGRTAWLERAADLRSEATRLARAAGDRDYARAKAGLADLADACNRCHDTFRVDVHIEPFAAPTPRSARPPVP